MALVFSVTPTNIEARLVDNVDAESIFVAVNRVTPRAANLPDITWTGAKKKRKYQRRKTVDDNTSTSHRSGPVTLSMTGNWYVIIIIIITHH